MATMLSWGDEAMEDEEISSPEKDYGMSPTSGPMEGDDLASVEGSPISVAKSDSMNFDARKNGYQLNGTHSAEDNISSAANEHVEHDQRSKPAYGSANDSRRRGGQHYDQPNTRRNGYGRGRRTYDKNRFSGDGRGGYKDYENKGVRHGPTHGGRRPSFESTPLPDRPPYKVHVSNLPLDCKEHHLPNFFVETKSDITAIEIKRVNNISKGWGFVTFGTLESMKHALTLSGIGFGGNAIKVKVAINKNRSKKSNMSTANSDRTRINGGDTTEKAAANGSNFNTKEEDGFQVVQKQDRQKRTKDKNGRSRYGRKQDRRRNRDNGNTNAIHSNGNRKISGGASHRNRNRGPHAQAPKNSLSIVQAGKQGRGNPVAKKPVKEVSNLFAALGMGDESSDDDDD